MFHKNSDHFVPEIVEQQDAPDLPPKQPYLSAINDLSDLVGEVEALFDHNGRVRTLTATCKEGLCKTVMKDNPEIFAQDFLSNDEIIRVLGLQWAELSHLKTVELADLGWRVEFSQFLTINGQTHPVRGGYVHVFINKDGHIFQVNSTVRHGRKPILPTQLISSQEAIEKASESINSPKLIAQKAELVYSAHNDRMDPCYEVTLTTEAPRKVVFFLVKATTGKVVHRVNKLHATGVVIGKALSDHKSESPNLPRRRRRKPKTPVVESGTVSGKVFLEIPDPKSAISKQVHDTILATLPDKSVLKNGNCIIYLGSSKKEVRCKADGSFFYTPDDKEFAAVATFFAFNSQMEYYKSLGMKAPSKPIPVYVSDPSVRDNAYFDPENYEIHIGIGSGPPYGLDRNIAYDLGVTWHENGHHVVYLQTPGKDLPGSEGGGIHESIGDVLGDLLMDFVFRLQYTKELGKAFTAKEVDEDPRIIGKFAMPPNGIRIQKNKARTPNDKTGEPHDDGLISGGAKADLLVAMATSAGADLKNTFADFTKLTLTALSLVPAHKVGFVDLLKAYLTADKQLFNEKYKALITKAFSDHGILLKTSASKRSSVIIFLRR